MSPMSCTSVQMVAGVAFTSVWIAADVACVGSVLPKAPFSTRRRHAKSTTTINAISAMTVPAATPIVNTPTETP